MPLGNDIVRNLNESFSVSDREEAVNLLLAARIEDGSVAGPRLLRCALVASRGSVETLREYVKLRAFDFRDVIMAGEYESIAGELVRVRDLNQPFGPPNQRLERP